MTKRVVRIVFAAVFVLVLAPIACSKKTEPAAPPAGGCGDEPAPAAKPSAAAMWAETCAVCHGESGEGGLGPMLRDSTRSKAELSSAIAERMPPASPGSCTGECADSLAELIHDELTTAALTCGGPEASPRRLRLLTRREYRNTVRDLLEQTKLPQTTCARATECSSFRQSCDAGYCVVASCDAHTFVFDPQGQSHTSVHVAGSFNGWASTVPAGGWPLEYSAETGLWTARHEIGEGTFSYKLVVDGSNWIADARNPAAESDGFGGQNSVLTLSCAGPDWAEGLPVENRPEGFAFDGNADAAFVTDSHVEAYLVAGERVTEKEDALALARCATDETTAACADRFLRDFGLRAFRRPLTEDEALRYRTLVTAETDPATGFAIAVQALLSSPAFLYRSEVGDDEGAGGIHRLTGWEVASALSYLFRGTMPDQALFDDAAAGRLDTPEGIAAAAKRLLADPRSRATLGEFATQWLGAGNILTVDKQPAAFPEFTDDVRRDMLEETRRFVGHVAFDGTHTVDELLSADYTFVNERLAPIYGMSVTGTGFRQQTYADGERFGLFGHGSVLGTTAHSDQTSPVRRGLLVRRNLLCQPLPPPPPNAGGVPSVDPEGTTRERFEQHASDPVCAACHQYLDPVGFAFERLDPIGRVRSTDNGQPVDPSGALAGVDGLGFGGTDAFGALAGLVPLLVESDTPESCFARQYFRFARGYRETLADRCARESIQDRFRDSGWDIRELMLSVATSSDFVERR